MTYLANALPALRVRPIDRVARERGLIVAASAVIALKVAFVFYFAWHTIIVMDEFGQLGFAKYLGGGIFETAEPTKALGFAAFYKLANVLGDDAVAIVRIARLQVAVLACVTLGVIYASARALGQDRVRALLVVMVLLSFSNFAERIFRTISEPVAVFLAATSLLVILRGNTLRPSWIVWAGILGGLAFLTTQKSVYFNLALVAGLFTDAVLNRRYLAGIARGGWYSLGWILPILAYCFAFPGVAPLRVARSIVYGPLEAATRGDAEYGGLRAFVLQTLLYNPILYLICFTGLVLALSRIRQLSQGQRIAAVFTVIVTTLVFIHNQPWPYVFIMALPFLAQWALVPFERVASDRRLILIGAAALVLAICGSFVRNVRYLALGNEAQLTLVSRAEALTTPGTTYFDGIGMLPNRPEPSTLWLDNHFILMTLRQGQHSEAYKILQRTPPKVIIWSYRMQRSYPALAPLIDPSYVRVAPNLWLAGTTLHAGRPASFRVPIAASYRLYDRAGRPVAGVIKIGDRTFDGAVALAPGIAQVTLDRGPSQMLLLPEGSYHDVFAPGGDDPSLFSGVYS